MSNRGLRSRLRSQVTSPVGGRVGRADSRVKSRVASPGRIRAVAFGMASLVATFAVMVVVSSALAADSAVAPASEPAVAASLEMTRAYDRAVQALIEGDEASAEASYREVLAIADDASIRDDRYALSCVELAMLRARLGDTDEAVTLMARAHLARRDLLGNRHSAVVQTRLMLRELVRQQRRRTRNASVLLTDNSAVSVR